MFNVPAQLLFFSLCVAFVFLALMEFTVVNYLWRLEGQRGCRKAKAQLKAGGNGSGGGGATISRHPSSDPITRRIRHAEGTVGGSEENSKSGAGSPTSNTLVQVKVQTHTKFTTVVEEIHSISLYVINFC